MSNEMEAAQQVHEVKEENLTVVTATTVIEQARALVDGAEINPEYLPQELATAPHEQSLTNVGPAGFVAAPTPAPAYQTGATEKFQDFPEQLRAPSTGVQNLTDIKRHTLAAAIEALDCAVSNYLTFPVPDNAMAVSSLSEQVLKMTKELEKSNDPNVTYNAIMEMVFGHFVEATIHSVAHEIKWLRSQTEGYIQPDRRENFDFVIKQATQRLGPGLKEQIEISKTQLLKILGIKQPKDPGL